MITQNLFPAFDLVKNEDGKLDIVERAKPQQEQEQFLAETDLARNARPDGRIFPRDMPAEMTTDVCFNVVQSVIPNQSVGSMAADGIYREVVYISYVRKSMNIDAGQTQYSSQHVYRIATREDQEKYPLEYGVFLQNYIATKNERERARLVSAKHKAVYENRLRKEAAELNQKGGMLPVMPHIEIT